MTGASEAVSLVDAREAPFWWVDWRVWSVMDRIGVDGFAVYCALRALEQSAAVESVTRDGLARATKLPRAHVDKLLSVLVDAGLITLERVAA